MRRLRMLGLVFILSFGATSLGVVSAGGIAATIRRADTACRAELTRSLGDDSAFARDRYVDCYREHGGVGEASFIVKIS